MGFVGQDDPEFEAFEQWFDYDKAIPEEETSEFVSGLFIAATWAVFLWLMP